MAVALLSSSHCSQGVDSPAHSRHDSRFLLRFDVHAGVFTLRCGRDARGFADGGSSRELGRSGSPVGITLNHASVLLGVVLFGIAAALLFGNRVPQWRGLKLPIIGAFLFFADVGLISSNAQSGDFPVCAVFAILVAERDHAGPADTACDGGAFLPSRLRGGAVPGSAVVHPAIHIGSGWLGLWGLAEREAVELRQPYCASPRLI